MFIMVKKKFSNRDANPETKPSQNRKPDKAPSMDSRQGHGLTRDEALQGKG